MHRLILLFGCIGLLWGCQKATVQMTAPSSSTILASTADAKTTRAAALRIQRLERTGLHNVFRVTEKLYSGGSPEGDAAFQALQHIGIRTVISVDGALPDVERAKRHGMRYVHLPFGYDGIPKERGWEIARAVRDLPGPIYLHCHHGKHRGPAAVALVLRCLDEQCTLDQATAWMKQAGTDPHYTGLYAVPKQFTAKSFQSYRPRQTAFPERNVVSDLSRLMVDMEHRIDHLRHIQKAGWQAPKQHADLDPPHEALLLWEHYQETLRLDLGDYPRTMRQLMEEAQAAVKELEALLRLEPEQKAQLRGKIDQRFEQVTADCKKCHAHYRDVPKEW